VYAGRAIGALSDGPRCFGFPPLAADALGPGVLRAPVEAVLRSIESDARRRNLLTSRSELDRWALDMGGATLRYLAWACFVSPDRGLPDAFVRAASLAYLLADCAIDVDEDLAVGILRVAREEAVAHQLSLKSGEPALDAWADEQARRACVEFERALTLARTLSWRMRVFSELVLRRKRRDLARALARRAARASHLAQ
jgi:hypothetical protein